VFLKSFFKKILNKYLFLIFFNIFNILILKVFIKFKKEILMLGRYLKLKNKIKKKMITLLENSFNALWA
jgi:hypothetical protein